MKRFLTLFSILLIIGYSIAVHSGIIADNVLSIKLYPCAINLIMFAIFFYSILCPPTIIEKLARLKTPDLPSHVIKYTKKVTIVWCGFFVINGLIALWTALFASVTIWGIYNGCISYLFIGIIFGSEFICRQRIKRALNHESFMQSNKQPQSS